MDFKDYYSTLGVAKTATAKEIKQAFRKLARKHHPDVNPDEKSAEAKFKELTEAYEVLGDPVKRKKYDELGANWRMYEQAGAGGAPGGAGPGAHGGARARRRTGNSARPRGCLSRCDASSLNHVRRAGAHGGRADPPGRQ